MTAPTERTTSPPAQNAEKATTLALRLAHAEHALLTLTSGQVDAIVAPSGQTYLLRPAQEHLRQSERRLQAVIESAADVITVADRGGIILSQSQAAERVLGYTSEELVGRTIFDLVHSDDWPRLYAGFFNVIEGFQETATLQFRHRSGDGSYRLIEATVGRLHGVPPWSAVFTLRSATMLRERPLPAARPEPAPTGDRFLAMLSHELRAPLAPALFGLEELQEDERFAEARPLLAMIRRNLDVQARLLEELTDFTTVGQHKVRLRLEPIDVHETVGFVMEICRGEIAAAQLEVLLYLRAEETIVQADSVRLQQVLWNLVKNAAKFSTPGTTISIATFNEPPGILTIEVADHGIGIEPELLPHVFEAFKQGHPLHSAFGGLGLGLFIAKGLAEAQRGTLTVSSKGRGQGTQFRLMLPTALPAEVAEKVISLHVRRALEPGPGLS